MAQTASTAIPERQAIVWDAHCGFESWPTTDLNCLHEWRNAGVGFLSVNVGYDLQPWHNTVSVLARYRRWLEASEHFELATSAHDVLQIKARGKMAVAFDIEGMNALNESLDLLHLYHELGVRQIVFAYNRNNAAGGGCHDDDTGLTGFGRDVVREMNRLGMLIDCSHCGHRTTMEAMALSASPVVFSHSNARRLTDHQRNIHDDQALACAEGGGVVGVNGIGLFLGDAQASTPVMADHVEYYLDLLGAAHVGIGLDYFPPAADETGAGFNDVLAANQSYWPKDQHPDGAVNCAHPRQLGDLSDELLRRGHDREVVDAVMGENFLRVAGEVWG